MTGFSVRASVEVDPTTLHRSDEGAISGVVRLRLGSMPFPEKRWNDLPVALVRMWLEALHTVRAGKATDAECPFMDGPFLFRVHQSSSAWRVEYLANDSIAQVELVNPDEFWNSLVGAGRLLVNECDERGWHNGEVQDLGHLLSQLARERAV